MIIIEVAYLESNPWIVVTYQEGDHCRNKSLIEIPMKLGLIITGNREISHCREMIANGTL